MASLSSQQKKQGTFQVHVDVGEFFTGIQQMSNGLSLKLATLEAFSGLDFSDKL